MQYERREGRIGFKKLRHSGKAMGLSNSLIAFLVYPNLKDLLFLWSLYDMDFPLIKLRNRQISKIRIDLKTDQIAFIF